AGARGFANLEHGGAGIHDRPGQVVAVRLASPGAVRKIGSTRYGHIAAIGEQRGLALDALTGQALGSYRHLLNNRNVRPRWIGSQVVIRVRQRGEDVPLPIVVKIVPEWIV